MTEQEKADWQDIVDLCRDGSLRTINVASKTRRAAIIAVEERLEFLEDLAQRTRLHMKECEHCKGTGRAFPDCELCEGNGWVYDFEDGGTMSCPECRNEKCSKCDGVGETEDEEKEQP